MTGYYANYYVADVGKVRRSFGSGFAHPSKEIFSDFSRIVSPQADFAEAISCIDCCLLCRTKRHESVKKSVSRYSMGILTQVLRGGSGERREGIARGRSPIAAAAITAAAAAATR